MKSALSRKNLWDKAPRFLKAGAAPFLRRVRPEVFLGKRFRANLEFVRAAQGWSAEQCRAHQLERVQRLCRFAEQHSSFYQAHFGEVGFEACGLKDLEDLRQLPTIDKDTIRTHLDEMCTGPADSKDVDYVTTGGTGGTPLGFYINAGRSAVEYAYLIASWERAGYKLGMPLAVFRGRVVEPDPHGLRHEYDPILRHHYYSNFHMSDENLGRYLEHVAQLGPCFLHVYPSSATVLARFLRRTASSPPGNIQGVIAESEIVYPAQRRLIEDVFGCRLFACYGHSEKLVAAAPCEYATTYHVWPTYGYCELLDAAGNPVTSPGERGEIVGTGFINSVVPFIRYRTGDWATYVDDHCSKCGRAHMLLRDIEGHRTQEVVVTADGSLISWTALNMHDDTFDGLRQYQLAQETPGVAVLRIVPRSGVQRGERAENAAAVGAEVRRTAQPHARVLRRDSTLAAREGDLHRSTYRGARSAARKADDRQKC